MLLEDPPSVTCFYQYSHRTQLGACNLCSQTLLQAHAGFHERDLPVLSWLRASATELRTFEPLIAHSVIFRDVKNNFTEAQKPVWQGE